jgi:hypothetical protein
LNNQTVPIDVSYITEPIMDFDTLRRYLLSKRRALIAELNALDDLLGLPRSVQSARARRQAEYELDPQPAP